MGICMSCEGGAVPRPADLGLPRNFTVFRELGAGGEGRTYLMRERLEDGRSEVFAAKVVARGPVVDVGFLLQGIRNQCSLNHVHIVRLLGVILTSSHLIIKLEYAAGGELFDYVFRQRAVSPQQQLSEEHARFLFMQLLSAVAHCHEHGVAHRDIKLSNVLLDGGKAPRVKICDFGLSKGWGDAEDCKSFTTVGTPLYMPPEVVKNVVRRLNVPHDLRKADVWSLGVMLFTMLLGRFPFSSQRPSSGPLISRSPLSASGNTDFRFLLRNIVKSHKTDLKRLRSEIWGTCKLSGDCRNLLDAMLCMDPSKRIGLGEIMLHPWVSGPLFLEHAQTIAACRDEMEELYYNSGRFEVGSDEDVELVEIVRLAAALGSPGDTLLRWAPLAERVAQDSYNGVIVENELYGTLEAVAMGNQIEP